MYFLNPFYVSNHEPHKWISSMYNSQNCFLSVWAYATNGLSFSYFSIYSIIMLVKTAQERMFLIWLIVLVCSVLGDCFWAHGVRSRISLQHHMWWRFLLCKNQHERTQRNKGIAFSPLPPPRTFLQKANSCSRPHPCYKCFLLWILRGLFHSFGQSSHHLIPSRNILMCRPWVMCYQSLRNIGSIKFIITIHHHRSPDFSTVKNVLVMQFLLEKQQIFCSVFHLLLRSKKIFSLHF